MAKINLTSEDLDDLSRMMMRWKADLEILNTKVKTRIKAMQDSWNDPQFRFFLNGIETTSQHIDSYVINMDKMGKSLKMYSNAQQDMNNILKANISSIKN